MGKLSMISGLLLLSAGFALGQVNFTLCPSQNIWTTTEFDISGCPDGASECVLYGGQTYYFTVTGFSTAAEGVSTAKPFDVQVTLPGTNDGLPLFGGNLCDDFADPSQSCPITNPWNGTFIINYTVPLTGLPFNGIEAMPVQLRAWKDTYGTPDQALVCMQFYSRWVLDLPPLSS